MSLRPSAELRRQVVVRSGNRCEYCLIHQDDSIATHQIDHVIAEKHGGATSFDNLALSCVFCNRRKGSDLSSIDPQSEATTSLFNPRTQVWLNHFEIDQHRIVGITPEGRTTVHFLQFNSDPRIAERRELRGCNRFPPLDLSMF